jgi:hypothetical protein
MTNEEDHAAIHEKLDELQAMLWRVKVLAIIGFWGSRLVGGFSGY